MQTKENYQKLAVWQKSYSLVLQVYSLIQMLPNEERYALGNQMRRAAVSIPSNIAEGYERRGKDFARFLRLAMGSRSELETQLSLCVDLNFVPKESAAPVLNDLAQLSKMLTRLVYSVGAGRVNQ